MEIHLFCHNELPLLVQSTPFLGTVFSHYFPTLHALSTSPWGRVGTGFLVCALTGAIIVGMVLS
jgi:hypothetical protein